MDILKWRSSYETGIPSMDEQHKKLIKLVNGMYRVVRGSEDVSIVDEVLKEMEEYAEVHFTQEEVLLKDYDYPEYESHCASHDVYREKLAQLLAKMQGGEVKDGSVQEELYIFLRHWWIGHISQDDKEYGAFLKEKGCS